MIFEEKIAVIFDIGKRYTKCGLSGEPCPRCIIPTKFRENKGHKFKPVFGPSITHDEVYDNMEKFIHHVFINYLLVNPKDCRIVLVESILDDEPTRQIIAKAFFKHYEAQSILLAPSHLMTAFGLGVNTALVVDIGSSETQVVPVYAGTVLTPTWQAYDVASDAIEHSLLNYMRKYSKVLYDRASGSHKSFADYESLLEGSVSKSGEKFFMSDYLEEIKVRICIIPPMSRLVTSRQRLERLKDESGDNSNEHKFDFPLVEGMRVQMAQIVREMVCEVLFEPNDDGQTLATTILDCLLSCSIDIRKELAANIILSGGDSMIPGLAYRLQEELVASTKLANYENKISISTFKFHQPTVSANFLAWFGASIFGSLEVLSTRSITRDEYIKNGYKIPESPFIPPPPPLTISPIHSG